tara:strand:- start:214 stop:660 length:447 start_codon:yes stop_codon:yes gene_type:complete
VDYLHDYIEHFPNGDGICFMGNPKIITKTMARTCKEIFDRGLFRNRVCLLDVPSHLIGINSLDFGDRSREEAKINENLLNSDLFILQELGFTKWNEAQRTRLYSLIYKRYSNHLPMFITVNGTPETLEENIGSSNFFRVADACKFIQL